MPDPVRLRLTVLPGSYSVCRLEPGAELQPWMTRGATWCIARTRDELSVVAESALVPSGVRSEHHWRLIQFGGPLPMGLTGILASVCDPLAANAIPIFAFSTFDTDYVMVRATDLERAVDSLTAAGHRVDQ